MLDVATKLELQAQSCESMGSPFTAAFIRAALADYRNGLPVCGLLDAHAHYARPALNLASAFHYLALDGNATLSQHFPSTGGDGDAGAAWKAARNILADRIERVELLFRGIIQTNEPARSMPILGGFLFLASAFAMPIRVFEIGASAGLNLRFDHYFYDAGDWQWGNPASPLVLCNRTRGGRPKHLEAVPNVVDRSGCDLNAIDATRREGALRLKSFVWPDQTERLARLDAALTVAARVPVEIDTESFVTWLRRKARPRSGYLTVILQSIVEEHLTAQARDDLNNVITMLENEASSSAPLAYLRMEQEAGEYLTSVKTCPDATHLPICYSDGHGQEILWL